MRGYKPCESSERAAAAPRGQVGLSAMPWDQHPAHQTLLCSQHAVSAETQLILQRGGSFLKVIEVFLVCNCQSVLRITC